MGKFAKAAALVLHGWEDRLRDQENRLHEVVPSSAETAMTESERRVKELKTKMYMLGYNLRMKRHLDKGVDSILPERPDTGIPSVPGREVAVSLPETKAAWFEPRLFSKDALFGFLTDPVRRSLEDAKLELGHRAAVRHEGLTRVTSDPSTLPMHYPSMALAAPSSFLEGYQTADKEVQTKRKTEMDQKLEAAKKEFEDALQSEYTAGRNKSASAGEFIDGLAQTFVKSGAGELNRVLGAYLAAAGLLGVGSHLAAKSFVEKRDPRYQKLKAMREVIKHRQRSSPMPIMVSHRPEEVEVPEDDPAANLQAVE